MRVSDLMTHPAVIVAPEASLREVATLLSDRRISGVPVVRDGEIVGVVSESDIIERERGPDEDSLDLVDRVLHRHRSRGAYATTAGEAMTSPAVVVEAWMSAYEAAWLMSVSDVGRLPVLDRGTLVGVIARADLVRYFARPDAEIEHDVREYLAGVVQEPSIDVHVTRGCVLLEGVVEDPADLECLPHVVSRVLGVVGVDSRVRLRGADEARPDTARERVATGAGSRR